MPQTRPPPPMPQKHQAISPKNPPILIPISHYNPFLFISIAIVTSLLNPALNRLRCLKLFSRLFFFPGLS